MSYQLLSTIRRVGVAAILAVCLVLPGVTWAKNGPPSSNPGQPFAEILEAIRGVTQNWDKKLDSTNGDAIGCNSDRFTCIFPDDTYPDGAAVRDNETGIVWERSPDPTTLDWRNAMGSFQRGCADREVGGRKGWHLPMIDQLASLVDNNSNLCTAGLCLPDGHPFQNVQQEDTAYWSATTYLDIVPNSALFVAFNFNGQGRVLPNGKEVLLHAWCVRGGQSFDGQDLNSLP